MKEPQQTQNYNDRPHILVVDDDARIRDLVARYLTDHDFLVMDAPDASAARDILEHFTFDAMVVDVMMPGEGGLNFTRFVQNEVGVPVILLTALGEADDRIRGLESGADDYLAKPFEPRELILRLQALLRRSQTQVKNTNQPAVIGRWTFDRIRKTLTAGSTTNGQTTALTAGEATLLGALYDQAGVIITREDLAVACGADPDSRSIDVQITRLRRKLEVDTRRPQYLQTVRGKGYVLHV